MKHWYPEDYRFRMTVKPDEQPQGHCRNGYEAVDVHNCAYSCPDSFCSKSMLKLFPLMEAARSGGDLRKLGGTEKGRMDFDCPDGVVRFRLEVFKKEVLGK
jgi:uncharacterized repeat protein (TIGR04076 family)